MYPQECLILEKASKQKFPKITKENDFLNVFDFNFTNFSTSKKHHSSKMRPFLVNFIHYVLERRNLYQIA